MKKISLFTLITLGLLVSYQANAKFIYTKTAYWGSGSEGNEYAIQGYDSTAYFIKGKPEKGSNKHSLKYRGETWLFASNETKNLFAASPEKYAPQYGGHCAWREAQDGVEVYGDAKIWTIVDGKLYLNYNKTVNNLWIKDIPGFIQKADQYWLKEFDTLN